MGARDLKRRLPAAKLAVEREIRENASSGGLYARGLAGEGYAGGYLDALRDVQAILYDCPPADSRRYWRYKEGQ